MSWDLFIDKVKKQYHSELPFVIYKEPNTEMVQGFFQKTKTVYSCDFSKDGFVFAPFSNEHSTIFFPKKYAEYKEINFLKKDKTHKNNSQKPTDLAQKKAHINLVSKGIKAIQKEQFKKVVLSRKETISLPNFDLFGYFEKLLVEYPSAFVYLWYHSEVGCWLGATPESLVSVTGNTFSTMALAGTQLYNPNKKAVWQSKELEEQKIVTDYIVNRLEKIVPKVKTSSTKTVRAGNLFHLQTLIYGNLGSTQLSDVVKQLHPTPAVCGFPTEKARQFIETNENYDREYYSGYLGEINTQKKSQLFVNLRCMKFDKNTASLYVGGGITEASNPEKEWEETVNKLGTIAGLLNL